MDKYLRVKNIGEGAFGKADLVKRRDNGVQYVIKKISIMQMGPKEREDSRKEVAVLAQLQHPNIVAYRESFEEHGSLFIVMDYCSGGDLYARINNQRGIMFTEEQILDWFVQMCLAIKHIHDRKILHRDIKSQNIFLTDRGLVQLGDFGIAKVLNNTAELARTCIGTPYYLSPEIVENKPYNNKSDIWSLGCVLYELSTLKHAFEAGNMKNLVLKIIRGSYPPLSPKYSYELRNLVAQLFKRAPRDRPSINSVLKKPLISQRISKFLTSEQLASEFSHTVMHGQKLARALPPPPKPAARPPSAGRNRPEANAAAAKKYDPSKIYGQPVIRKSNNNRGSADLKKRPGSAGSRPGSAAGSRPGSAAGSRPGSAQDLQRKRQDLQEKERKRREEEKRKAEEKRRQEYERRHKELQDKQRVSRMNRAREEGWKNVIGSLESNSSGDGNQRNEAPREFARPAPRPAPKPMNAGGDYNMNNANAAGRGKYDHYNQYLDKLQQDRQVRQVQDNVPPQAPAGAYMGAPRPSPGMPQAAPRMVPGAQPGAPVWRKAPEPTPMYHPYNNRAREQQGERARLVDDFINRRKEAAVNKQRGQAELFGPGGSPQRRPPSAGNQYRPSEQERPSSANSRDREEQEYLEKLRQIRQQNYNERRNLQANAQMDKNPQLAAEERKKKAEALKKQAEDWAKQRKDVLEQKRQELFEKERRLKEARQNLDRPGGPVVKPSPAVPMTGALNAIGVTPKVVPDAKPAAPAPAMTGILGAIGATPRVVEDESRPKTPIQKQKEEILRKLNEKGPPEDPPESARSKWGAAGEIKIAEQEPERPSWGKGPSIDLGNLALEETASQMEITSARDKVIMNPVSARRQWGKPGETVLNALQGAALSETTTASNNSEESVASPPSTDGSSNVPAKPVAGGTIVISKGVVGKGTITLRKPGDSQTDEVTSQPSIQSGTYTSPNQAPAEPSANQDDATNIPANENAALKPCDPFKYSTIPEVTEENILSTRTESKNITAQKPPVPSNKPKLAEKPLVLPKPVLLPKPDAPKEFAPMQPVSVKSEGAGSLFEKVDKESEQKEKTQGTKPADTEQSHVTISDVAEEVEHPKSGTGLKLGLTIGSFDAAHRELLRTCSEPDLASLFKTLQTSSRAMVKVRSLEEMSAVDEDEDDSLEAMYSSMERAQESAEKEVQPADQGEATEEQGEGQTEEEQAEEEEDEDIADLLSVRETMQSLLLDDSEGENNNKKSPIKFSQSSDRESRGDTNDGDVEDTEEDDEATGLEEEEEDGAAADGDNEDNGDGDEDNGEEDDNLDNLVEAEGDDVDAAEDANAMCRSHSVDNENPQTPEEPGDVLSELFQTDESDSEFNDENDDGDFDLFGRLEESRMELEEALGAEKLIKVYKTVQALQEDEDENMEEGARIAQELLGKEKEHLYPKIFQLVMADAAFTDDNDLDLDMEDFSSSF